MGVDGVQNGALASHRGTVFGHPEPHPLQLCDMKIGIVGLPA
eukprot:COSAG06_NODE_55576_length_289_cov_0.468421_1_plen_41_part_01